MVHSEDALNTPKTKAVFQATKLMMRGVLSQTRRALRVATASH